jgi:hypothetical protein
MLSSEGKEKRLRNLSLLLRETSQSVKISISLMLMGNLALVESKKDYMLVCRAGTNPL